MFNLNLIYVAFQREMDVDMCYYLISSRLKDTCRIFIMNIVQITGESSYCV